MRCRMVLCGIVASLGGCRGVLGELDEKFSDYDDLMGLPDETDPESHDSGAADACEYGPEIWDVMVRTESQIPNGLMVVFKPNRGLQCLTSMDSYILGNHASTFTGGCRFTEGDDSVLGQMDEYRWGEPDFAFPRHHEAMEDFRVIFLADRAADAVLPTEAYVHITSGGSIVIPPEDVDRLRDLLPHLPGGIGRAEDPIFDALSAGDPIWGFYMKPGCIASPWIN